MRFHNVMEDIVCQLVDDVFSQEELSGERGFCTDEQCKTDVTCYVLNQVSARYIVSGRGLTHFEMDYLDKLQREIDLLAEIYHAAEVVSKNRRPFPPPDSEAGRQGPCLNPPTLTGRVVDAESLEPISNVDVYLYRDGQPVPMIGPSWQNPVHVVERTPGFFSFWPGPLPAPTLDHEETIEFEIGVEHADYEPLRHFLQVTLQAQNTPSDHFSMDQNIEVRDLSLVRRKTPAEA